jgi:hypothetical protein
MEHAAVWFSFKTVVIGGLLLALAIFVLGMWPWARAKP